MKRVKFLLLFTATILLFSFGFGVKNYPPPDYTKLFRNMMSGDTLLAKYWFILNEDTFKLTNSIDGQILIKTAGVWTNADMANFSYDSLRFDEASGILKFYKNGLVSLSDTLDGRYPLQQTFEDSIAAVRAAIPDSVMRTPVYDPGNVGGQIVNLSTTQSLSNKTLLLPAIFNFSNANHDHSTVVMGGLLNSDNINQGNTNLFSPFTENSGNFILSSGKIGIGRTPDVDFDVLGTLRSTVVEATNMFIFDGNPLTSMSYGLSDNAVIPTKGYVDDLVLSAGGYTDEQAQDAVGAILDDGTTGDVVFTYNDGTPKISGEVENDSHNHTSSTISGLSVSDFSSPNISNWTNNSNYTPDTYALGGDLGGTIAAPVVQDDSHNHVIGNVDNLQTTIDDKVSDAAYDVTWNGAATIAPSKNATYDKFESLTPVTYCPASVTVNKGTLVQGMASDLCAVGGTDVIVQEVTGSDPLRVTLAFSAVQRLTSFSFYGRYSGGASHIVYIEAYNYTAAAWQLLGELGTSSTKRWYSYNIFLPTNFISAGATQVRFNHQGNGIATHQLILDYVDVNYGGAGGSSFETLSEIAFIPAGTLSSTNGQAVIQELDAEKAPVSGSANYIQNQNASAQTANIRIDGNIENEGDLTTDGDVIFAGLASTDVRLVAVSPTGQVTPIEDGANGEFLRTNGGGDYTWGTSTGATNLAYTASTTTGLVTSDTGTDATINVVGTVAGTNISGLMVPADKTKLDLLPNAAVQALSGTTPSWNVTNGVNATITLSGNTTITFSNLTAGVSGNLSVTNPSTAYSITFAGYNVLVSQAVWSTGDSVLASGGSKIDSYSWYYDGSSVFINGTLDYK
jgi:hypothetical protein